VQVQRDEAYRALRESQRQLVEKNLELERLTHVDGLTGLSNRRFFNSYIESEWNRAVRSKGPLSVLMVDVDFFKLYNDTYGHIAGDDVLKQIADTVRDSCRRSTDLAARYGGEEFVVVLPDTPFAQIQRLADKLCDAVQALHLPHTGRGAGPNVTISVGGATAFPHQEKTYFELLDAADKALYEAKRAGKNRAVSRMFQGGVSLKA
jgi:two-component system chemotaxis family response regulator WspR